MVHENRTTKSRMRCRRAVLIAFGCLVLAATAASAEVTIEMQAGDRIVVRDDGSMTHYDKSGARVDMADGAIMTTRDGHRILMKSQSLWREIVAQAARAYGEAHSEPKRSADRRTSIELVDGGLLVVERDGSMTHYDASRNRISMRSGVEMTAKDGAKLLMQDGSLWESVSKHEHLK